MEFDDQGDVIACFDQCYTSAEDMLIGTIEKDSEGYFIFYPARKVNLVCNQLFNLANKLKKLNKGDV